MMDRMQHDTYEDLKLFVNGEAEGDDDKMTINVLSAYVCMKALESQQRAENPLMVLEAKVLEEEIVELKDRLHDEGLNA